MKKIINPPDEEIDGEQTIRRAFSGSVIKSIDADKRQIEFIISTADVDRMGDIIEVGGWDLKAYKKNPVVLFGHASSIPPIGKAIKTWKDGEALRSIAEFMPEDISAFAHSIFRMYQEKFLNAVSVGFRPLKWERMTDEEGNETWSYRFKKQELLEFSSVPIPANPEALIAARQKGIDTLPFKAWAEEMLDNWNETRKPLSKLYGVDRKGIEQIRRRAAGAGAIFHISPDVQDEIMKRNLEAVRAAKAKKAKQVETVEILGTKFEFPVIDEKRLKEVGDVQISSDEVDGVMIHNIDKADDIALFSKELVEDSADDFVELEVLEEGEEKDLILRMKGTEETVEYDLIGVTKDGSFYGMKVREEASESNEEKTYTPAELVKAAKDKTIDRDGVLAALRTLSAEELAEALEGIADAEVVDLTEEDLEEFEVDESDEDDPDDNDDPDDDDESDDESDDDKSADDEESEEKGKKPKKKPKPNDDDDEKAVKDKKNKLSKSEDDEDMDFPTFLLYMEEVLCNFEETLDKHGEKGNTRREQRRLEFLAGYMRDLADSLDGGEKSVSKESRASKVNDVKDDEISEEEAGEYVKSIVTSIKPHLTKMIESKVSKLKGRLD